MNEEIQTYIMKEMMKSYNSLQAAKTLLETNLLDDSISRAYYAVYHAARCALKVKAIEPKSHKQLISEFALRIVKNGDIEVEYGDILRQEKEDRESGDYEVFVSFEAEEVRKKVEDAKRFVHRIEAFLKRSGFSVPKH